MRILNKKIFFIKLIVLLTFYFSSFADENNDSIKKQFYQNLFEKNFNINFNEEVEIDRPDKMYYKKDIEYVLDFKCLNDCKLYKDLNTCKISCMTPKALLE